MLQDKTIFNATSVIKPKEIAKLTGTYTWANTLSSVSKFCHPLILGSTLLWFRFSKILKRINLLYFNPPAWGCRRVAMSES